MLTLDIAASSDEESLVDKWESTVCQRTNDIAQHEYIANRPGRVPPQIGRSDRPGCSDTWGLVIAVGMQAGSSKHVASSEELGCLV